MNRRRHSTNDTTIREPVFHSRAGTVALTLLAAAGGCGGELTGDGSQGADVETGTAAVLNGTLTTAHPEVVKITAPDGTYCSAVMITHEYFLTAGHCTDDGMTTLLGVNGTSNLSTSIKLIRALTSYPDLVANTADLGMGRVTRQNTWPAASIVAPPSSGSTTTLIGYGRSVADDASTGGIKRYRTGPLGSNYGLKGDSGGEWMRGGINDPALMYGVVSGEQVYTQPRSYINEVFGYIRGAGIGFELDVDRIGSDYSMIATTTRNKCKVLCEQDGRCMSFTFDGTVQQCHLKSAAPSPTPAVASIDSGLPVGLDLFNLPGSDLRSLTKGSADLCRIECARDSQCLAFTWVAPDNTCYIKNARPAVGTCPTGKTCYSGVRRTQAPPAPPPPPPPPCGQCIPDPTFPIPWDQSLDWGTDRPGSNLPNMPVVENSPTGCADKCELNGQCKSWTYVSKAAQTPALGLNSLCWLKSSDAAPFTDTTTFGLVSGQKGRRNF